MRRQHSKHPITCCRIATKTAIKTDVKVCWRTFSHLDAEKYQRLRATVNDDKSERFYAYSTDCEQRCGWGREEVHLGDVTWLGSVAPQLVELQINHKRPLKGSAQRDAQAVEQPV